MVEFNKIIKFIIYILKILIYFDTKFVKFQSGGNPAILATAKSQAVQQVAADAASKAADSKASPKAAAPPKAAPPKAAAKASNSGSNSGSNSSNNKEEKDETDKIAEDSGDSGFSSTITFIKETIMSILNWFGGKGMEFLTMLLFASTAPIIPFFVSMAGMFGVLKYFMYKLRRL